MRLSRYLPDIPLAFGTFYTFCAFRPEHFICKSNCPPSLYQLPDVVMTEITSVPEEDGEEEEEEKEEEEQRQEDEPEDDQTPLRASGSNMICDLAPGVVFANIPIPDTMRGGVQVSIKERILGAFHSLLGFKRYASRANGA